ncbi:cupin domain-containing protein [Kineococcus sp. NBC_00420]|uniref:cupin domain-containing protein n=1 Tax=Kineococcus sp. NBC_00420 TaxID=2903564 RepID=UPI002E201145
MELPAGSALDTRELVLENSALGAEQVVDGSPTTGSLDLGTVGGVELGVWEMTTGTMHDVETDEVFVVVAGRAEVLIEGVAAPLVLAPGTVGRLAAGSRTTWTVSETLRKVYLLGR